MIPRVIHYCWFGHNPKPEMIRKCMETWEKTGYKIIEWNEDNFDINSNPYVCEAYKNKKWAFVTDYVRLYVLYNYGGIYLDSDVEVVKPLDDLLGLPAFSGFEDKQSIPTGLLASEQGNKWIKILLDDYEGVHFLRKDGKLDLTTNVSRITNKTKRFYPIKLNNTLQEFDDFVIFPFDYFCAKSWMNGVVYRTKNTYTIHHFSGSWEPKYKRVIKGVLNNMIKSERFYEMIRMLKKRMWG